MTNKTFFAIFSLVLFLGLAFTAGPALASTNTLWSGMTTVTCQNTRGQLCNPKFAFPVTTTVSGPIQLNYEATECSSMSVGIYVDGAKVGSTPWLGFYDRNHTIYREKSGPVSGTFTTPTVSAGNHTISLEATGKTGGCNLGYLHSWELNLQATQEVVVANPPADLTLTCSVNPVPATVGQTVTFTANPVGGTGSYTYNWSGVCTGNSQTCSKSFAVPNSRPSDYQALLSVTSGTQTKKAQCYAQIVPQTCTPNVSKICQSNAVYNVDSCGNKTLDQTCTANQTCSSGACVNNQPAPNITCSNDSQCPSGYLTGNSYCNGNNIYQNFQTYRCNNPGTTTSSCVLNTNTTSQYQSTCSGNQMCSNGSCINNNNNNTCISNSYRQCGNNNTLYTYDSCGNQQASLQCGYNQTCSGNACVYNNNNNYGNLTATEYVRNITQGGSSWLQSVYANPSDILEFKVVVQSNSSQPINNIMVREVFPSNLIYRGNLTLDGITVGGDVTQGVNIGTLSSYQTKTLIYQAQVAGASSFAFGTTTISDPVNISSTDSNFQSPTVNSVNITVTKSGVQGATYVPTGLLSGNPLVDSFFLPLLLIIGGFLVVRTWRANWALK